MPTLKLGLGLALAALAYGLLSHAPASAQLPGQGDLFVVSANCCGGTGGVVRVNPSTGTIAEVTSPGGFSAPFDLVLAPDGNLFVADSACCGGTGGVIEVNPTTGGQAVIASGGHFARPRGIVLSPGGDLFVADSACCGGAGGVIRVNPTTGAQTLVSSGGNFSFPVAIVETLSGELVVADSACCGGTGGLIRVNPTTGAQESPWVGRPTVGGLLALALLSLSLAPPLRAQGSISFVPGPGSPVPAGNSPQAVAAADLNGDGKADLVTANFISNDVTILLGNGQGGFTQAASSPVGVGSGPTAIALGDFNQDGSATVIVLLGNAPCPPPSARPKADCRAPGAVCHVTLRGPGSWGGVIATGRIVSGPCQRSDACLQFEIQASFTVSGSLADVPVGALPIVRIPMVDRAGTPIGSREVRCTVADWTGRVRCDTKVAAQSVFPRLDGRVQVSVSPRIGSTD